MQTPICLTSRALQDHLLSHNSNSSKAIHSRWQSIHCPDKCRNGYLMQTPIYTDGTDCMVGALQIEYAIINAIRAFGREKLILLPFFDVLCVHEADYNLFSSFNKSFISGPCNLPPEPFLLLCTLCFLNQNSISEDKIFSCVNPYELPYFFPKGLFNYLVI